MSNSRSLAFLEFPIIPNVVHGGEVPPLAAQGLFKASLSSGYPSGRRDKAALGKKKREREAHHLLERRRKATPKEQLTIPFVQNGEWHRAARTLHAWEEVGWREVKVLLLRFWSWLACFLRPQNAEELANVQS